MFGKDYTNLFFEMGTLPLIEWYHFNAFSLRVLQLLPLLTRFSLTISLSKEHKWIVYVLWCAKYQHFVSHYLVLVININLYLDSKAHGANMGPTWVLLAPGGPHVGPMNLAIRVGLEHLGLVLTSHLSDNHCQLQSIILSSVRLVS